MQLLYILVHMYCVLHVWKKTLHKRNGESYITLLRNLGLIGLTAMAGVPSQVGRPAYDG